MEDRVGVVAVEAELEEVARGERCLDGPELDVEVAVGGFKDHLCTLEGDWLAGGGGSRGQGIELREEGGDVLGLGLEVVAGRHFYGGCLCLSWKW